MDSNAAALHQVIAAWVQAIGSIVAIIAAIRIASREHRREIKRRESEDARATYLLEAELTWVSHSIVDFLNQYISIDSPGRYRDMVIDDEDVSDILVRLNWCRQRAEHKGQLAMLGELRDSLLKSVRILRMRNHLEYVVFSAADIAHLREWREAARGVLNHIAGSTRLAAYES